MTSRESSLGPINLKPLQGLKLTDALQIPSARLWPNQPQTLTGIETLWELKDGFSTNGPNQPQTLTGIETDQFPGLLLALPGPINLKPLQGLKLPMCCYA